MTMMRSVSVSLPTANERTDRELSCCGLIKLPDFKSLRYGMIVVTAIALCGVTYAKSDPAASGDQPKGTISFAVASIHPNKSDTSSFSTRFTPSGLTATNTSVAYLIKFAYELRDDQLIDAPRWLYTDRFDIQAKVDEQDASELQKETLDLRKRAYRAMTAQLLADRFQLKIHEDSRSLPVFALVVVKGGIKMTESVPDAKSSHHDSDPTKKPNGMIVPSGAYRFSVHSESMNDFAIQLSERLGMIIVNDTGLQSKYDFLLFWFPDYAQLGPNDPPPPNSDGPTIYTALREQLGLQLISRKEPIKVVVVEKVSPPSPN